MRPAAVGWVVLLGWGLLAGGAAGQQMTGVLSMTGTAGYQTNPYLDPMLGEWDPDVAPEFVAFDPAIALRYSTSSVQIDLAGQARVAPRRLASAAVPLVRGSAGGRYALASAWAVGLHGGASRYRLQAARDTWWSFPMVAWQPTARTTFTVRGGWAGRRTALEFGDTSQQTSAIGMLGADTWLADRWQGQANAYVSTSRAATGATTYGGTGVTASLTYWWTHRLALRGHATIERIQYDVTQTEEAEEGGGGPPLPIGGPPGSGMETTTTTRADRIGRGGAEVRWTARPGLTLFARAQGLVADLQQTETISTDVHVGAGLRWSLGRTWGERNPTSAPAGLWHNTDDGLRFHVRYEGEGQLYVTGTFNDWANPGYPLRPVGSDRHAATLPLPPGRYEYRIRIVEDGSTRWLSFPEDTRTVPDGFGGVNGICVVE